MFVQSVRFDRLHPMYILHFVLFLSYQYLLLMGDTLVMYLIQKLCYRIFNSTYVKTVLYSITIIICFNVYPYIIILIRYIPRRTIESCSVCYNITSGVNYSPIYSTICLWIIYKRLYLRC